MNTQIAIRREDGGDYVIVMEGVEVFRSPVRALFTEALTLLVKRWKHYGTVSIRGVA